MLVDEQNIEGTEGEQQVTTPEAEGSVTPEAPQERPKSKRQQVMEQVAAKRRAQMAQAEPEPEPEPRAVSQDQPESEEPSKPPVYQKDDGKWYTTRRVNGVDEEVDFETLRGLDQKLNAGDQRLREAAERQKEIDRQTAERQKELDRKAQELKDYEAIIERTRQEMMKHPPAPQPDPSDLAMEYHKALMDSDPDDPEDQQKLATMFTRLQDARATAASPAPAQPPIDADAIAEKAALKIKTDNWNRSLKEANTWFENEHQDINGDEILKGVATQAAQKIMAEKVAQGQAVNPTFSQIDVDPKDVYAEAVSQTKDWLKGQVGATSGARREQKREASGKAAAGSGGTAELERPPRPKTQAEKIADMRRARGLPV